MQIQSIMMRIRSNQNRKVKKKSLYIDEILIYKDLPDDSSKHLYLRNIAS